MRRSGWFTATMILATALACTFLLLPLVALFLRTSPGALLEALGSPPAREALVLSLKTSAIAHVLILGIGTPVAYLLGTRVFRGRRILVALLELPLVLPPAVAGLALLAAFGRLGLLGGPLDRLGVQLAFTEAAVVMAIVFVASPFYIRQAIATFEGLDAEVIAAARALGARPWHVFSRIALPLSLRGLGAGSALAWARGLGEFGATIMFAGSFPGVTRTLPLAIYAEFDRNLDVALALGALLVIVSATLLVTVRLLAPHRS
jgi:molybdate transport system permease protein